MPSWCLSMNVWLQSWVKLPWYVNTTLLMFGFKPNSQVHSQFQLHFHLICWNMSGNTSSWALKLPDEANAYMVFGIGLFKYSITNVNTKCVIKFLKYYLFILDIKRGKNSRHTFAYQLIRFENFILWLREDLLFIIKTTRLNREDGKNQPLFCLNVFDTDSSLSSQTLNI